MPVCCYILLFYHQMTIFDPTKIYQSALHFVASEQYTFSVALRPRVASADLLSQRALTAPDRPRKFGVGIHELVDELLFFVS